MSNLPEYERIRAEDFKEPTDNEKKILTYLTRFMEPVYRILKQGITLNDNISAQVFTTESFMDVNLPIQFVKNITGKATAVLLAKIEEIASNYAPITSAVSINWREESGNIIIDNITGLTALKKYKMTVVVI